MLVGLLGAAVTTRRRNPSLSQLTGSLAAGAEGLKPERWNPAHIMLHVGWRICGQHVQL